jgi:hypothetical protein
MSRSRDREIALDLLKEFYDRDGVTPEVMLELARHLCHLAGGDGRGRYTVVHDPHGDRVKP